MRLRPYLILCIMGVMPILALSLYSYRFTTEAIERRVESETAKCAQSCAMMVSQNFVNWLARLVTLSGFTALLDCVESRNIAQIRYRLKVLVESDSRIDHAFVTDPAGLLWCDYPDTPESLGRTFNDRDWYLGVSADWQPYVSNVYRHHAEPRPLVVALAAPLRKGEGGPVLGAIVYQVRLEAITPVIEMLDREDDGSCYLLDSTGTLAAHSHLDLQAREYTEYRAAVKLWQTTDRAPTSFVYRDPILDVEMIAASARCMVRGRMWTVVTQQPRNRALAPATSLGWQILFSGMILGIVIGGLFLVLARFHNRVRTFSEASERANVELRRENQGRLEAEQALQRSCDELETRVEERTQELRRTQEQLLHAQKMEAIGLLAGGIAHDFNNMLSVIIGYAELTLRKSSDQKTVTRFAGEILESGERAALLTRQLLAFSRKQVLEVQVLDLNDVVKRVEVMLRRLIGEDIELAVDLTSDLPAVETDPGQLGQVLMNLAINARDAMPEGGKLTIETGTVEFDEDYMRRHPDSRVGPHVMLAISDTGIGMDQETQARIFEPFFTTKARGQGTGLGLSTVYGIVQQSGGTIWVYSEPGQGTVFKIYLPALSEPARPLAVTHDHEILPTGSETILVVDDDASVRRLAGQMLRESGYTVLEAAGEQDALLLAEQHRETLDLLVTDVVLCHICGPELAARLQGSHPALKILYISGYTDNAIVHHGVLDAGTNFLQKPLRSDILVKTVRRVLDQRSAGPISRSTLPPGS